MNPERGANRLDGRGLPALQFQQFYQPITGTGHRQALIRPCCSHQFDLAPHRGLGLALGQAFPTAAFADLAEFPIDPPTVNPPAPVVGARLDVEPPRPVGAATRVAIAHGARTSVGHAPGRFGGAGAACSCPHHPKPRPRRSPVARSSGRSRPPGSGSSGQAGPWGCRVARSTSPTPASGRRSIPSGSATPAQAVRQSARGEQPGVRYGLALGELLGAHSSTSSTRPWLRTQVTWPSAWWKRIGLRQLHRVIPTTTLGRVGTSSSGGSNSPSPGSWPLLREAEGRRPATRRRGRPPPRSRTPRSLEGGRAGIAGDVLLDYVAGDAAVAWTIRGHFHPIVTVRPEYVEVMT